MKKKLVINRNVEKDNNKFFGGNKTANDKCIPFYKLFEFATKLDILLIIVGIVLSALSGIGTTASVLLYSSITEFNATNTTDNVIEKYCINQTFIAIGILVTSFFSQLLMNYTALRQIDKIRSTYLEKVLNQDISWYDVHNSGDFSGKMAEDMLKLEQGINENVSLFVIYVIKLLSVLLLGLINCWKLVLVSVPAITIGLIVIFISYTSISKLSLKQSDTLSSACQVIQEALTSIKTVVAFGGENKEINRYNKHLNIAKKYSVKRSIVSGLVSSSIDIMFYATFCVLYWYGAILVLDEKFTTANMMVVILCVFIIGQHVEAIRIFITIFAIARSSASKIFSVIENEPIINQSKMNGVKPETVNGHIIFNNVVFKYPNRKDVQILKGFNLNVNSGERVALIGSSGSGKTTCVQLLQRFYDPTSGIITLDGRNLKDLNLIWLRDNISIVSQEPVLFGTTIAKNIQYGNLNATPKEIEAAAKTANAHNFINKLPQKYETVIGEGSTQLSGGQKQRIAIARALIKNPSILLLDEATSALDSNKEASVQSALYEARKGRTTITIAHRLSTIRNADRIIVISDGINIEEGTHEELMSDKASEYYNLITSQIKEEIANNSSRNLEITQTCGENKTYDNNFENVMMSVGGFNSEICNQKFDYWNVIKMNKCESLQLLFGFVFAVLSSLCKLMMLIFFGNIFSMLMSATISDDEIKAIILKLALYILAFGVATSFMLFLKFYLLAIGCENVIQKLKRVMFKTIIKQDIGWFDLKENSIGSLCSKLSNDAAKIQDALCYKLEIVLSVFGLISSCLIVSFYYTWQLAFVLTLFLLTLLFIIINQQNLIKISDEARNNSLNKSTKYAVEAVANIRTVASLNCEKLFHEFYVKELFFNQREILKTICYKSLSLGLSLSISHFASSALVSYGQYLIKWGMSDMGRVFVITQINFLCSYWLIFGVVNISYIQSGIITMKDVVAFLNITPKIKDNPDVQPAQWTKPTLKFDKVYFSYPNRKSVSVLNGLNLNILHGKTVALVGASGCGKTTIVQLLERFYDPNSGCIFVNEQDIKSMPLSDLRKHLSIVSQEPNLFDRTIAENIAYGDNDRIVPIDEIVKAAKVANIHNFVASLPLQYETELGEKGLQLSGGQKQRIAIARALIRNPKVLILDEATSALDVESEKIVQDALDEAKTGRTCLIIAHRLTTIQSADVICVLNEGRIVEFGTHFELLQRNGIYYDLYKPHQEK